MSRTSQSSISSSNIPPQPQPSIRFHILQGRNLAVKDLNGFSDPYVTVKLNKLKTKTKVIYKNLNPDWYEILELAPDFSTVPTVIKLTCWDKDTLSKDFMGSIKIPLISLFDEAGNPTIFSDSPANSQWYDLLPRTPTEVVSGQIRLSVGFHISHDSHWEILKEFHEALNMNRNLEKLDLTSSEASLQPSSEASLVDKEGAAITLDPNELNGLLYLDVVSASDLPYDTASTGATFDMDPFVVVSLGRNTFKTSTIRHNLNPEWNERIVFQITPDLHKFSVKFSLYDYDKFSNNDHVGSASISMSSIVAASRLNKDKRLSSQNSVSDGKTFPLPLTLKPPFNKGNEMSQLVIRAEFVPYEQVRRNFWNALTSSYDADDNGNMNKTEIATMLESLTDGPVEEIIENFFHKFDKSSKLEELTFDELAECLEELASGKGEGDSVDKVFNISSCPICQKKLNTQKEDLDTVSHIAVCASKDPSKIDRIVMGNFITEAYAQRKWFTKIATFVGYGEYKVGQNNANILVQERATGEMTEEKMPTYIKLGIRLLYNGSKSTAENSHVKRVLQTMSVKQGKKFNDPLSVREIEPFINFHNLNREEILDPIDSFKNFNEFFYRKLKADARKLGSPDPRVAVSPADSRVMVFPTIDNAKELWIKGEKFTIGGLFNNLLSPGEVEEYEQGSLCIFRLAPQDYHRFHIPVDGVLSKPTNIDGQYYTVNPMAIRSHLDVYGENKRCFSFIESKHHGTVAMICIGAMMVGSIILTSEPGKEIARLDEHGYFAFGGSTILVLFQKGKIQFDADLVKNSSHKLETLLQVGNSIGIAPSSSPPPSQ